MLRSPLCLALLLLGCTGGTSPVVINEIQTNNVATLANGTTFDDWLELYNGSEDEVDLSGYTLSDRVDTPDKFTFADGTVLGAGEYLLVWCDKNPTLGPLHADFRMSALGESVHLFTPVDDGSKELDGVEFGASDADFSYSRYPDGGNDWSWCSAPTPGASNGEPDLPGC